jgi:hypothetical protein
VKNFQLLYSLIIIFLIFCIVSRLQLRRPTARIPPLSVHHHRNKLALLVPCVLHFRSLLFNYISIRCTYIKIILGIICILYFRENLLRKHFCVSLNT